MTTEQIKKEEDMSPEDVLKKHFEAKGYITMTTEETRQRIAQEAEAYADSIDRRGCSFWRGLNMGHTAGSTVNWNKAVDACIESYKKTTSSFYTHEDVTKELEALKIPE